MSKQLKIFANEAPKYWNAGYSAYPVKPDTKQAAVKKWSDYCNNLPSEAEQHKWVKTFPAHNIGICLGKPLKNGMQLGAIDIDRDDLVQAFNVLLEGKTNCARVGKKGVAFIVKLPAVGKKKGLTYPKSGNGSLDILASGSQLIIPPSIHKDTGSPYRWLGRELLDFDVEMLPALSQQDIEATIILGTSDDVETIMAGRKTHTATLNLSGQLVKIGLEKERIIEIMTALFPAGYSGNSLKELPEMIESALSKGFMADLGESDEDNQKALLLRLVADQMLFHNSQNEPFACYQVKGVNQTSAVGSSEYKQFLCGLYYREYKSAISHKALSEAMDVIKAKALYEGPEHEVFTRVGHHKSAIYVDLGRDDGSVVQIANGKAGVTLTPPVYFIRPKGFGKLPIPDFENGDLTLLSELINVSQNTWKLIKIFLVGSLNHKGPYMVLILEGEQGSGKSFTSKIIKSIIDPSDVPLTRSPKDERDLMVQAKNGWLLVFDNLSGMSASLSDSFCRLATGGGIITRKLYTDDEAHIFQSRRPCIMNGIADIATRPDLLERSILLKLEPMEGNNRKTESDLLAEFEGSLPEILGGLYNAVAIALANKDSVKFEVLPRMADFAAFVTAAEEELGLNVGEAVKLLMHNQNETTTTVIESHAIAQYLIDVAYDKELYMTVGELYDLLCDDNGRRRPEMPKGSAQLSRTLKRLKPALAKQGVIVEFGDKTRLGRLVRVMVTDAYKAQMNEEYKGLPPKYSI